MRRQGGKEEGTGDNSQTGGLEREQRSSQSSLPTFPFLRHPGPDPLRIVFRCVPFLPPLPCARVPSSLCCSPSQHQLVPCRLNPP